MSGVATTLSAQQALALSCRVNRSATARPVATEPYFYADAQVVEQLQQAFDRDWNSKFAVPLP